MQSDTSHSFVLVPGAWHGAFVWNPVVLRLRALGHTVTALTLTGLAERRHVGRGEADLATHVQDVVAAIEIDDLTDVTLVGWSYGGMVTTGVRARIPERVARMVYLDAFLPEDGKALIDYVPPEGRSRYDGYKEEDMPIPAISPAAFGVSDPILTSYLTARTSPQPWRTFYQPVSAPASRLWVPTSYVLCTGWGHTVFTARSAEIESKDGVVVHRLDADHYCMLTSTDETLKLLLDL